MGYVCRLKEQARCVAISAPVQVVHVVVSPESHQRHAMAHMKHRNITHRRRYTRAYREPDARSTSDNDIVFCTSSTIDSMPPHLEGKAGEVPTYSSHMLTSSNTFSAWAWVHSAGMTLNSVRNCR